MLKDVEKLCSGRIKEKCYGKSDCWRESGTYTGRCCIKMLWKIGSLKRVRNLHWQMPHLRKSVLPCVCRDLMHCFYFCVHRNHHGPILLLGVRMTVLNVVWNQMIFPTTHTCPTCECWAVSHCYVFLLMLQGSFFFSYAPRPMQFSMYGWVMRCDGLVLLGTYMAQGFPDLCCRMPVFHVGIGFSVFWYFSVSRTLSILSWT